MLVLGILLPQYSPYKIAENAKTLSAFFPNRIDIGLVIHLVVRLLQKALMDNHIKPISFPRQVSDLQGFLYNSLPEIINSDL